MRTIGQAWLRLGLVIGFGLGAACSKSDQPAVQGGGTTGDDAVVAEVGDRKIRQSEVDRIIESLPTHQRGEFGGVRGRQRLVDQLVNRELMLKAAEERKLDQDPQVRRQIDEFRTTALVNAYQRQLMETMPKPSEAQIRAYFDSHPEEFVIPARINASWIKCRTKAEAERARKRIVDGDEHFGTVAQEVSVDTESRKDGGLLGYFNPTGYVRGIGSERGAEFAVHAFELEVGDVGPLFQWDDGWAFIKVHEKTSERAEPFERAKDRIAARLQPALSDSIMQAEFDGLRQRYAVKTHIDLDKELEGKSAEDLMRLATEANDARDKIEYYRVLLRKYPRYERADEAQFMVGFVLSEELQDFEAARPEYQKVIDSYPDSDIKESAQYMLQNMGQGRMPDFDAPEGSRGGAAGTAP
jgi:peptidyl-prolyl cis-trans isomerase C